MLLRDALVKSGKIAIAKVVIRARQHLAAIKPQENGLMLELMHFPSELIDVSEFKAAAKKSVGTAEMRMAEQLIESMTTEWKPEEYTDEYRDALENLIEEKIEHGDKAAPAPPKKRRPSNVVDLVSILQKSIQQSQEKAKASGRRAQPTSRKANRRNTKAA